MPWIVLFHPGFEPEFDALSEPVQDELLALATRLEQEGPALGRPHADTLKGSVHANMKELRLGAMGGVWRIAFAFDPERQAILLVAGDKSGSAQARFYKMLIRKADERFSAHLADVKDRTNDDAQAKARKPSRRQAKKDRRPRG